MSLERALLLEPKDQLSFLTLPPSSCAFLQGQYSRSISCKRKTNLPGCLYWGCSEDQVTDVWEGTWECMQSLSNTTCPLSLLYSPLHGKLSSLSPWTRLFGNSSWVMWRWLVLSPFCFLISLNISWEYIHYQAVNFSEWWQSLLSPIARERTGNKHQSQTQSSEEPLGALERTPRWLSAGFQKRSWGPGSKEPGHSLREFSFGFLKQVHCLTEHFCQLLPVLICWQLNSMLFCKRVGKPLMVWYQQLLNSSMFPLGTRGWQWDTAPCPGPVPQALEAPPAKSQTHRNWIFEGKHGHLCH